MLAGRRTFSADPRGTRSILFFWNFGPQLGFGIFPFVGQHVGDDADFGGELEWIFAATVVNQFDEERRVAV